MLPPAPKVRAPSASNMLAMISFVARNGADKPLKARRAPKLKRGRDWDLGCPKRVKETDPLSPGVKFRSAIWLTAMFFWFCESFCCFVRFGFAHSVFNARIIESQ